MSHAASAPLKTIVAIHGIGDQTQFATAQLVVSQLCRYFNLGMPVPLGRFHATTTPPATIMTSPPDPSVLADLAFAEVYWAGIAREVESEGFKLEETKSWGRTITNRLAFRASMMGAPLPAREQVRVVTVLDELVDTIAVLERINLLASKAGLFNFNLHKLLTAFVGDVQIVADFPVYRDRILKAFDEVMSKIVKLGEGAPVECYLVAHSEGSVVAFLALLKALADPERHPWIESVRGIMTIGSPIETHHLLWPELWQDLRPSPKATCRIEWRNYYDHGDPIAYGLTETKNWLEKGSGFDRHLHLKETAFSRSFLPGKAHTDYWTDDQLFAHFIGDVIRPGTQRMPSVDAPQSSWAAKIVSYVLPQVLIAAILCLATYFLYRPAAAVLGAQVSQFVVLKDVIGIGLLLLGVTAASRIPRLTSLWFWWTFASALLAASMFTYSYFVSPEARLALGNVFTLLPLEVSPTTAATAGVLVAAALVAVVGGFLVSWWPALGVRMLPVLGVCVAAVPMGQLLIGEPREIWPILLGGVIFFYLWWLAALLFDLVFVWHRYVRYARAAEGVTSICQSGYHKTRLEALVDRPRQPSAAVGSGAVNKEKGQ